MLNLAEYRSRFDRLADHLPWAALVAPGVVLNKDGSFQRSFAFRGPDLESSTEAELVGTCARANNVLRRLGSGWAIFFEAHRREISSYPRSRFWDAASWLIDEERRAAFEAAGHHFESLFTGTLLWLPPADSSDAASRSLIERPEADGGERGGRDWRTALAGFIAETDRILDLFAGFMPEVRGLSSAETLSYLHDTVSDRAVKLTVPETPVYLDAVLADTPFIGGLEPRLGRLHVRTLTLPGFPNVSRPGLLDALNHQGFGYRWMTRFIAMDRVDATKVLTKLRRQWFNKRKSITALLREVMYNQPTQLVDSDADNKVVDADIRLAFRPTSSSPLTGAATIWHCRAAAVLRCRRCPGPIRRTTWSRSSGRRPLLKLPRPLPPGFLRKALTSTTRFPATNRPGGLSALLMMGDRPSFSCPPASCSTKRRHSSSSTTRGRPSS